MANVLEPALSWCGTRQNLFQLGGVYAQADVEHGVIDRAHNNVLEHLAAMGLFVASLYLIVSGYFLWAAYCLSSRLNTDAFTSAIGAGSLLADLLSYSGVGGQQLFRPRGQK